MTVVSLVALAAFPVVVSSQMMGEKARREKLGEIALVVEPQRGGLAKILEGVEDPFFTSHAKVSGGGAGGGAAVQAGELSPEAILEGAANLMRPTGLMMGGAKRFVVSSLGELYEVGKPLRVTLADGPHDILVESADSEGYVLKCGAVTISRKFVDHSGEVQAK